MTRECGVMNSVETVTDQVTISERKFGTFEKRKYDLQPFIFVWAIERQMKHFKCI
jgi:hypothetical protein